MDYPLEKQLHANEGSSLNNPLGKTQIGRVIRNWKLSVAGPTQPAFPSGAGTDGCSLAIKELARV